MSPEEKRIALDAEAALSVLRARLSHLLWENDERILAAASRVIRELAR